MTVSKDALLRKIEQHVANMPPVRAFEVNGQAVLFCEADTQGIVYADFMFDLNGVTQAERPLVGLLCRCLKAASAKVAGTDRFRHVLGGFEADIVPVSAENAMIRLRTKCFARDADKLAALVAAIYESEEMLCGEAAVAAVLQHTLCRMDTALVREAEKFTPAAAGRRFFHSRSVWHEAAGIGLYHYVLNIHKNKKSIDFRQLLALKRSFLCPKNTSLRLTCDKACLEKMMRCIPNMTETPYFRRFLATSPHYGTRNSPAHIETAVTRSETHSVASALDLRQIAGKKAFAADDGVMAVVCAILDARLTRIVRQEGGAYGTRCSYTADGLLTMLSYGDPHTTRTIDTFAKVFGQACEGLPVPVLAFGVLNQFIRPRHVSLCGYAALERAVYNVKDDAYEHFLFSILETTDENAYQRLQQLSGWPQSVFILGSRTGVEALTQTEIYGTD